jgi:PTS system nitrogen regulatory IIA component
VIDLDSILPLSRTAIEVDVHSRKRALEWISEKVSSECPGLDAREIYQALQARERLGSTGLGEGIAIPHCRVSQTGIRAVFIRLAAPVDFDSPDGAPVDLLVGLIVPESENREHLTVLAALSAAFSDAALQTALRSATTPAQMRDILLTGCRQHR